MKLKEMIVVCF